MKRRLDPERVSTWMRRFWAAMSCLSAGGALAYIIRDDANSALTLAATGIAFYLLSHWRFDDFDF